MKLKMVYGLCLPLNVVWWGYAFRSLLCRPLPLDIGRCTCVIVRETSPEGLDGGTIYSLSTNVRSLKLVKSIFNFQFFFSLRTFSWRRAVSIQDIGSWTSMHCFLVPEFHNIRVKIVYPIQFPYPLPNQLMSFPVCLDSMLVLITFGYN